MADPKVALVTFCNLHSAVFALFGNRITPDRIPDNQPYPNARVKVVTAPPKYLLGGGVAGRKIMLQIDIYADSVSVADNGIAVLEQALSGYRGMLGDIDAGFVFVRRIDGEWNEMERNSHRILEVEIATNA